MKQPANDIFFLIKSLSKAERKFFRQFAERHTIGEQNNYLKLFDAIDQQMEYDEQALKSDLRNCSFLAHFAVVKQYLHRQILESLHHFHQNNSEEEQLKKDLHLSKILIQRKLLTQAENLLQKAKKQIEEHALWEHFPEYESANRRLLKQKKGLGTETVRRSSEAYLQALKMLEQHNAYWWQSHSILSMHLENVKANQPEKQALLNNLAENLLQMGAPEEASSKIEYFKALATYFFMNGKIAEAAAYNRQSLEFFDEHPALIAAEAEQYIAVFNNYIIDNHILGNYELLEAGILRLRKLPEQAVFKNLPNLKIKIVELTYSLQLNARIAQQQFASALELLPDLKKEIENHRKAIAVNYLLTFYYLMAYIRFFNGLYEAALDDLEALKNPAYKGVMTELQLAADRLLLLCHFELGNYLLLDNLLQNIRRTHRQQKIKSELEDCLFKYLKKMTSGSKPKQRAYFQAMATELKEIKSREARAWNYFDFDAWVQASLK